MQIKSHGQYPAGWAAFAEQVKNAAGWQCVRCGHPHDPKAGYTLTVHHLTMNKAESFDHWFYFAALCQRCHLSIQARVVMYRPWPFEHSDWFKPFAAGHYALKYLGIVLTRQQVMSNLDYYLGLEVKELTK